MITAPKSWSEFLGHQTKVCGIINLTPDSFSDGGKVNSLNIEDKISNLISEGAHVIDVGAESTRPNAIEVSSDEQIKRLNPIVDLISGYSESVLFSVDTRNHEVALFALANGFHIVNDVSGGAFDSKMNEVVAQQECLYIMMHSRGTPQNMNQYVSYDNLVDDVIRELNERIDLAIDAGVKREKIMVDPGFGFAKTPEQNITIMENLKFFQNKMQYPVMVGISRKSMTSYLLAGDKTSASMDKRDELTAELSTHFANQGIDMVRVHNVEMTVEALQGINNK